MLNATRLPATAPRAFGNEIRQINSFLLANICDVVVTGVALMLPGFVEKGLVAGEMFSQARTVEMLILKTAVTAFMIGVYALAMHRSSRWSKAVGTAMRIATILVWAVVAWNEFNILLALGAMA